jgi:membrane protease subunit HflC
VQEIKGKADAQTSKIHAKACTARPRAADFYTFMMTLDTYKTTLGRDTTLILTTDSDVFRLLKSAGVSP